MKKLFLLRVFNWITNLHQSKMVIVCDCNNSSCIWHWNNSDHQLIEAGHPAAALTLENVKQYRLLAMTHFFYLKHITELVYFRILNENI